MPVEHIRPDRWDEDDQYIAGYQEDEDFSDVDSDSSDTTARSISTLNSLEVNSEQL
jgi:hypothetical protein